jgi:thiol-disulfide isomerase/thioredoxin
MFHAPAQARHATDAPMNTTSPLRRHARAATLLLSLLITAPLAAGSPPQQGEQVRPAGPPWLGLVANARPQGQGLLISKVLKASPASRAGLREDDILMTIDGKPLSSSRDFKVVMREHAAGDTLAATIIRDGRTRDVKITLEATPSQAQLATAQLMGEQAPGLQLIMLKDGAEQPSNLNNLRGKPVVLEFWATWCQACQQLTPTLNALKQRHGDKLHILAVSGEPIPLLLKDFKATGKQYTVAQDPEELGHDDFFVRSYPLIYILDREHKVRKVLTGYSSPADIEAAVQAVMKL